jgi:hypothetical protein
VIAFVIFASGLKYVGVETTALGWILCATLLACGGLWVVRARPGSSRETAPSPSPVPEDSAPVVEPTGVR